MRKKNSLKLIADQFEIFSLNMQKINDSIKTAFQSLKSVKDINLKVISIRGLTYNRIKF